MRLYQWFIGLFKKAPQDMDDDYETIMLVFLADMSIPTERREEVMKMDYENKKAALDAYLEDEQ